MKHYFLQVFIAIDQLINALLGGWADETLSSRSWRRYHNGSDFFSKLPCRLIDTLFFWDKEKRTYPEDFLGYDEKKTVIIKHCQLSYESEIARLHVKPEMRM